MNDDRKTQHYLEFSCQSIEFTVRPGENCEGSFKIYADHKKTDCRIYSTDTRMRLINVGFDGNGFCVDYCFESGCVESGSLIKGEFVIISNCGEYSIPYNINVQRSRLQSSLGPVKNLFHFTNLAQTDWDEAVELFYSPEFEYILHKNDKSAYMAYKGLSRNYGNNQNVEEFLIETNKKTAIIYDFDAEGFMLEDIEDNTYRTITIKRNTWGYSDITVDIYGEFITAGKTRITSGDFLDNICYFDFDIDATRLHKGNNIGKLVFSDSCNTYTVPVEILMESMDETRKLLRERQTKLVEATKAVIDMKLHKISYDTWIKKTLDIFDGFDNMRDDDLKARLFSIQMLLARERYNEAGWQLNYMEEDALDKKTDVTLRCYYLYLTTLINHDEGYAAQICDEIKTIYANNPDNWWTGWFALHLDEACAGEPQEKWKFMELMYDNGCHSPLLYCEAFLTLQANPKLLYRLEDFEQQVLLFGARKRMLKQEIVDQIQYLAVRKESYSPVLYIILSRVYNVNRSAQTIAAICHTLILGDRREEGCHIWYALGVENMVRVTKLYEYYMMSLDTDSINLFKGGHNQGDKFEIPKTVLLYFAYQSTLDYKKNAFLYAYILKNAQKYPDLEKSYRIAIEKFAYSQIREGHINENLSYIYDRVVDPQMLDNDTAYAFAPLLFMHKITVSNPRIKTLVVIHEKIIGESTYPVNDGVCMVPIFGHEYKLFLQDEYGNRYTQSVGYKNRQLMEEDRFLDCVRECMNGRLSFDIYLCEIDKNYVTINASNVRRFKNLVDSMQVAESFKKEIRTKLLRYYYDNDMIGELDAFLEEVEADHMEPGERAEFIRYLISRGMFDKAYLWVKEYGLGGVDSKMLARLISKSISVREYDYDEFLVNVSYYIYRSMKYDEKILEYLLIHYEGRLIDLRNLWKSAIELELDTTGIMYRILKQILYTNVVIQEKDRLLLDYAQTPDADGKLINTMLMNTAYDYFVNGAVVDNGVFELIYRRYNNGELDDICIRLCLLKFWSENPSCIEGAMEGAMEGAVEADIDGAGGTNAKKADNGKGKGIAAGTVPDIASGIVSDIVSDIVPVEAVEDILQEFLAKEIYFPFYQRLALYIPRLHYFRNRVFIQYQTDTDCTVRIHYSYEDAADSDGSAADGQASSYKIDEMKEMYDGIHVASFRLFYGETLQYYITESYINEAGEEEETVTQSDTLFGSDHTERMERERLMNGRFALLNDIIMSRTLKDETTARQLTMDYVFEDFSARRLFRLI